MTGIIIFIFINIFSECTYSGNCSNDLLVSINQLVQSDTNMSEGRKVTELENKQKLFNKLCDKLSNSRKIIIIEKVLRDINSHNGIIYSYDEPHIYLYNVSEGVINIPKDGVPDTHIGMLGLLFQIRDSTSERLKAKKQSMRPVSDAMPVKVYSIDLENKISELVIL